MNKIVYILIILFFPDYGIQAQTTGTLDIGTHKLHYRVVGEGKPTVVIDVGVGESYTSWQPMIDRVSKHVRVFAYDRAGYGQSESGPMPRDANRAAYELKCLLDGTEIRGPYLLVGHSLGGLHMQVFADRYADVVAGLVLLDPPPLGWISGEYFPDLKEMFQRETDGLLEAATQARRSSNPEERNRAGFLEAIHSEHKSMLARTGDQVLKIESFGDFPMVVIAAERPNPMFGEWAEAYQAFWIEESRKLTKKSSVGVFVLADGSGHHIHLDAPDVVYDVIIRMLEK